MTFCKTGGGTYISTFNPSRPSSACPLSIPCFLYYIYPTFWTSILLILCGIFLVCCKVKAHIQKIGHAIRYTSYELFVLCTGTYPHMKRVHKLICLCFHSLFFSHLLSPVCSPSLPPPLLLWISKTTFSYFSISHLMRRSRRSRVAEAKFWSKNTPPPSPRPVLAFHHREK